MEKQIRCVYNKATFTEMGVICDKRKPNSLCKNCKSFKPKYPTYCCQKCGKPIGYIGRFIEFITFGLIKHECKYFN